MTDKQKFAELADSIMAELTANYRTDRTKNGRPNSFEYGFVLAKATADMGKGSEHLEGCTRGKPLIPYNIVCVSV